MIQIRPVCLGVGGELSGVLSCRGPPGACIHGTWHRGSLLSGSAEWVYAHTCRCTFAVLGQKERVRKQVAAICQSHEQFLPPSTMGDDSTANSQ